MKAKDDALTTKVRKMGDDDESGCAKIPVPCDSSFRVTWELIGRASYKPAGYFKMQRTNWFVSQIRTMMPSAPTFGGSKMPTGIILPMVNVNLDGRFVRSFVRLNVSRRM